VFNIKENIKESDFKLKNLATFYSLDFRALKALKSRNSKKRDYILSFSDDFENSFVKAHQFERELRDSILDIIYEYGDLRFDSIVRDKFQTNIEVIEKIVCPAHNKILKEKSRTKLLKIKEHFETLKASKK
jgi:hypothetical protein